MESPKQQESPKKRTHGERSKNKEEPRKTLSSSAPKSLSSTLETAILQPKELIFQGQIGKGMFGTVWLGKCRGQEVAIKKLNVDRFDDGTVVEITKEVKVMTHLHHPNIILFMGACLTPGHVAIVTEYMTRGDLHRVIHDPNTNLGFFQKCLMTRDITAGITWLHRSNPPIIHRDIKPSNMLVGQNYEVKLCDFGLSIYRSTDTFRDKEKAPGTPLWMAPEVMQGRDITEKCDVYAFGIVLWELFTGLEPFPEYRSINSFLEAICRFNERPQITREMITSGKLTKELSTLITLCWDKDPATRPDAVDILPQIYSILLSSHLHCPDAILMWRNNWPERQAVSFAVFSSTLYRELGENVTSSDIKHQCLEIVLCANESKAKEKTVTLERWSLVLNWTISHTRIGPLKSAHRISFLDRLVQLMSQKWFHGDVDKQTVENLLNQSKKKNSYLVRFSYTDSAKTPFTLSRLTPSGISSYIIFAIISVGYFGYITNSKKDKAQTQISEKGELSSLVKSIAKTLRLESPLQSPYSSLFNQNADPQACYESSPSNSDDFDEGGDCL